MMDEDVMPETDGLVIRTFACVWDALTDSPAEAAAMRVRSDLLSAISDTVTSWDVTRVVAAQHLDLTRPRLDELLRGSVGQFSIDELIGLATRAGLDVRVQAQPARAHHRDAAGGQGEPGGPLQRRGTGVAGGGVQCVAPRAWQGLDRCLPACG